MNWHQLLKDTQESKKNTQKAIEGYQEVIRNLDIIIEECKKEIKKEKK